jgi:aspartokinase/homoserine dehydrogenase 1
MKGTLVMKFGGTSVGSGTAIRQVIDIVRTAQTGWKKIAIIVSAMSTVTDRLLNGAKTAEAGDETIAEKVAGEVRELHMRALNDLGLDSPDTCNLIDGMLKEYVLLCHAIHVLGEASPRALDSIASLGERMNTPLVAAALNHAGVPAQNVDSRAVVLTDSVYQSASPDMEVTWRRAAEITVPIFEAGQIPVITGFIGANSDGVTTTLGRGGSDFSAAIFGAVLDADEVWIWTDVTGVMTTDPRIDPLARTLSEVTYREVSELAYYGAKVLHPKSIRPVIEQGIQLWVRNTFEPQSEGTRIIDDRDASKGAIRAVSAIRDQCIITVEGRGMLGVPGIAARLFSAVARQKTSVVMISQASSEQSICIVVPLASRAIVTHALEEEFRNDITRRDIDCITSSEPCAIITVVGTGMRYTPGIAGRIFSSLGEALVNVIAIAQGSSECSISLVVDADDVKSGVLAIHRIILSQEVLQR